jgi:outer membrane protein assembly factor BamB/predicted Ser/Thr protein kinase
MSSDTSTGTAPTEAGEAGGHEGIDTILGKTIDACKVIRKLGQGGMGVVYLAEHETLNQEFVLKILNPALTGAEDTVERFFREAQACAQLNHPGIVAIQNVGQEGDYYFIRMEFVEGVTLEDVVKTETQVEWKRATQFIVDVAEALSHAHQKGMIHRDIKPENIMLTPEGQIKVMDFGLAKHVHSSTKVSVTGQIVGTPFFMSPEQAGGKPTDARSDIYSLGVTLYYMATGVKPFNGKNLQEIFLKHFFYAPESPKIYNDALPESLCEIIKRCLKKKKKERYQSAKALARDLLAVLGDPEADLADLSAAAASGAGKAPAQDDDAGDKTIATRPQQSDDDGGATVQVGATANDDDDGGGATVKVASGEEEKTVAVGGARRPRGEVKSVSFSSASMVFNEDEDSTLQIDQEEEEDAHAGLDLPTSVINAAMGGDPAFEVPGAPEAAPEDLAEASKARKKKMIVAALVLLIPSVFFLGMHFSAKGKIASINDAYNAARTAADSAAQVEKVHYETLYEVASDYEEFRDGYILAPTLTERAAQMADTARNLADRYKKKYDKKANDETDRLARLEQAQTEKLERDKLVAQVKSGLALLSKARQSEESNDVHWTKYTKQAFGFLAQYAEAKSKHPALADYLDQVQIPVMITSDPGGAQIFLNDNRAAETMLTPPNGSGVAWLSPYDEFSVRVVKKGFEEFRSKPRLADEYHTFDATLPRKQLRPALSFGNLNVEFGADKNKLMPIMPIHPPRVVGDGSLFFVDQAGLLRSYTLEQPAKLMWLNCPGGAGCKGRTPSGEPIKEVHRVGFYGDPTPTMEMADAVILVSSLGGYVSAHDRSEGHRIWRAYVGSPVTSPARYLPNQQIVAVGTGDGRVVFISEAGIVKKWSFQTDNAIVSAPYLIGTLCIVGSTDNRLYVLDWKKEKRLSRLQFDSDLVLGPIPVGRRLLVGTAAGQIHLIEVSKQGKARTRRVFGEPTGLSVAGLALGEVGGKRVLFFSVGRNLHAVDLKTGESMWRTGSGKAKPFYSPAGDVTKPILHPDGKIVYIGGGKSGFLFAIDTTTGKEIWRFPTPRDSKGSRSPIHMAPILIEDELYVISRNKLYVLDPE